MQETQVFDVRLRHQRLEVLSTRASLVDESGVNDCQQARECNGEDAEVQLAKVPIVGNLGRQSLRLPPRRNGKLSMLVSGMVVWPMRMCWDQRKPTTAAHSWLKNSTQALSPTATKSTTAR